MLVTRVQGIPPDVSSCLDAVVLFHLHRASPLESQANFPPLARSVLKSRIHWENPAGSNSAARSCTENHIQLIANGSHRQIAYPGTVRKFVPLRRPSGSLTANCESHSRPGNLRDIHPNDLATHLKVFVTPRCPLFADCQELELQLHNFSPLRALA